MTDIRSPHVENDEATGRGPSVDPRVADAPGIAPGTGRPTRLPTSLVRIGLEVLLISAGVFLGLMGEQWRERAQHRELADASLRRFRTEILANRKAVASVKDYHIATSASLERYFAADPQTRKTITVRVRGLQPVFFERTAWDLALVTESLAYTDPQVALALSRVYTLQQDYADLTRGVMLATYVRPPTENEDAFLGSVKGYYGDLVLWEPRLLDMYDELIARIDRTLGASPGDRAGGLDP